LGTALALVGALVLSEPARAFSNAHGIHIADTDGYAKATVSASGSIETYGRLAHGIFISGTGDGIGTDYVYVSTAGSITTEGNSAKGVYVHDTSGDVAVLSSGNISTTGLGARGIEIYDTSGDVTDDQSVSFNIDLLGLSLETGLRFGGRHLYLQPHTRLAYVQAWAGAFEDASGESIDLESGESLAGEFSARFGAMLQSADLYIDAGVRHEFLGVMRAEVSDLTYTHELPGTSRQLAAGISLIELQDMLSLGLEGGYAKGSEVEEYKATAALRLKF
jgi:hypothetical protein